MTVVIADTSPINYLLLIGEIAILPGLYRKVMIPPEVLAELTNTDAPPEVSRWVRHRPEWLEVSRALAAQVDPSLLQVDPGERAAILLAQQQTDVLLLIDDAAGRAEANRRGIPNTGTLGVLRAAAIRGVLDLRTALARLMETNFRISQTLVENLLAEAAKRESPPLVRSDGGDPGSL